MEALWWLEAFFDGDTEMASMAQVHCYQWTRVETARVPGKKLEHGFSENGLPEKRVPAPRDRFYDAVERLAAIMEADLTPEQKNLVE